MSLKGINPERFYNSTLSSIVSKLNSDLNYKPNLLLSLNLSTIVILPKCIILSWYKISTYF